MHVPNTETESIWYLFWYVKVKIDKIRLDQMQSVLRKKGIDQIKQSEVI